VKFWANTYLAGAVWGTSLIVAAVVAFVLLVSLQTLHEWPISGLGVGVGNEANNAHHGSAVIGEGKPAPNLNVGPNAGPSVAANSAADAPIGTAGKRRHSGGTRGGGVGSLADRAPIVSPASAESPVASNPGSHSPAGAGATPAAPQAGPSETGGSSGPAVRSEGSKRGGANKTPNPSPTATKAVARNPGSGPPADAGSAASASHQNSSAAGGRSSGSETKGQSGQEHGANWAPGPPASTAAVPQNPDPGPPGASSVRGHS
jgi:hypothetical protein